MEKNIALIRGDGIGPEIVNQAVLVLDRVAEIYGHSFHYSDVDMGGNAIDKWGEPLPEAQMDAISALSGCGPAFVYLMLEALADAGVACGLPRGLAQEAAAQTALGAAQMVLQTGKHPAALKDEVCSPGGSTIAGVLALERGGFRAAAEQAVLAAFEKTKKLGNL